MPVAQQPSQQHHHHLFTAIGTFLHALQPSSHHNNPNPNSSVVVPLSSPLPGHGASEIADLYQAFESQLAQRLVSLIPAENSPSVCLAFLKQLMGLLLVTQTDFRTVIPTYCVQINFMEEFLERSIKLLDACRGIKEQFAEMEILQGMLHFVALCLNSDEGDTHQGQVSRARKVLAQLLLHMEVEREDQANHVHTRRSFRGRLRERLCSRESSPQRWHSWHAGHAASPLSQGSSASSGHSNSVPAHGNNVSALGNHAPTHAGHVSTPSLLGSHGVHGGGNPGSQALHTLELNLLPPKLPPKDEEECFAAAIYALNVVSIFSLGTITAAFPCFGKVRSAGFIHPPHTTVWASPFLCLQEKVDEELSKRSKKHGTYIAGMWELDQIAFFAKRLLELISVDDIHKLDGNKEELKKVVKIFSQHVQDLERDMGELNAQINEYYNRVLVARMGVLDLMSGAHD